MSLFQPATRTKSRLRLALDGPAGSGKTFTSLRIATAIAAATNSKVAVIDTERGSASKYAGGDFEFDVLELESFHPQRYIEAIQAAAEAQYGALIIDSLSHAWMGRDGALELVDRAAKAKPANNSYTAWRDVTPLQNDLLDSILRAPLHVIATLRSKQEYVQEKDHNNKTVIRKVGLAPIQRDGVEYEFDVFGHLNMDNDLVIGKTRCPDLTGAVINKPGAQLAKTLLEWLGQGEPEPEIPAELIALFDQHKAAISETTDLPALKSVFALAELEKGRFGAVLWDRMRAVANRQRLDIQAKGPVS